MIGRHASHAVPGLVAAEFSSVGDGGAELWFGATLAGLFTVIVFLTIVRIVLAGHLRLPADPDEPEAIVDEAHPDRSDLGNDSKSTGEDPWPDFRRARKRE